METLPRGAEQPRILLMPPDERTADDNPKAGLWLISDKVEQAANALLKEMICRLAGMRCSDLRVYLIRVPDFNATCAPNGMVSVCSGLLLRCQACATAPKPSGSSSRSDSSRKADHQAGCVSRIRPSTAFPTT